MTRNWKKIGSKIAIYLSLGLHRGCTSYKRSLQPSKENIQHFKTWNLYFFLNLWVIFALLDPPTQINADPCRSGSTTLVLWWTKITSIKNLFYLAGPRYWSLRWGGAWRNSWAWWPYNKHKAWVSVVMKTKYCTLSTNVLKFKTITVCPSVP